MSSASNQRPNKYGGVIANRARFMRDVLEAMVEEAGADRIGLKIFPEMNFNDLSDATPTEHYTYLVDQEDSLWLAYLHVAPFGPTNVDYHAVLRPRFNGAYLIGNGQDQIKAEVLLSEGKAEGAFFGSSFLANPDLSKRFQVGAALNAAR